MVACRYGISRVQHYIEHMKINSISKHAHLLFSMYNNNYHNIGCILQSQSPYALPAHLDQINQSIFTCKIPLCPGALNYEGRLEENVILSWHHPKPTRK